MPSKAAQSVLDAVYAVWKRMGIPDNLQVDNELAFFGSPIHPRGMGPLIRLCLLYGVNLYFIPVAEPWRNGMVEKFNDHYRQKFLAKVTMTSKPKLRQASLAYEHKHNSTIATVSSKDKRRLRHWLVLDGNWSFQIEIRLHGIPWRNRKKDAIISCVSSEVIAS